MNIRLLCRVGIHRWFLRPPAFARANGLYCNRCGKGRP